MTRNEILRLISSKPALAAKINQLEGTNFTRVKTPVLLEYIEKEKEPVVETKASVSEAFESAAIAFLVTLEQKGLLDGLLAKIK
jgi:hypothetical protein